uniref:Uncharacterized protein n=1 Tax=Rhodnius prolixus TaxID=13249 RepID=T1HS57_RHOPR
MAESLIMKFWLGGSLVQLSATAIGYALRMAGIWITDPSISYFFKVQHGLKSFLKKLLRTIKGLLYEKYDTNGIQDTSRFLVEDILRPALTERL